MIIINILGAGYEVIVGSKRSKYFIRFRNSVLSGRRLISRCMNKVYKRDEHPTFIQSTSNFWGTF